MDKKQLRNTLLLICAAFIWGTAFVAQSVGSGYMGAYTFLASRSWLACVFLLGMLLVRRAGQKKRGSGLPFWIHGKTLVLGGICCGTALFAASAAQQMGIGTTSTAKAGFMTALYVVLVPVFGRFGHLLCEIARRCRAEVHTIEVPWGEVFKPDQVEDAIKRVRPRLLLTVQGDTSTTMLQPLAELGEICRRHDVLFYTDATASLGGNPLETDAWQLDAVSAGMQKCLGGPSGTSPITLSPRMEEVIRRRRCIEQGIRTDAHHDGVDEMIYSNYFDLGMVMDYWGPERLNHHTEATSALFAARECARLILQEGLDNGIARHKLHGDALLKGIQAMGLETFGDLRHKMNNVLGVVIPNGVNGDQVRKLMLEDFGIEIGTSFGPLHGKVWRIGTMGYNARKDCVMQTLSALEAVLNYLRFTTTQGAAMQAAWDHYRTEATL